jgi:Heterokaryon incompatibility protein (HET)
LLRRALRHNNSEETSIIRQWLFAEITLNILIILDYLHSNLQVLFFNMRLLSVNADGSFRLTWFAQKPPIYAILSHTWEADDQEVTFKDLTDSVGHGKIGYRKIQFCAEQAKIDGLQYFWVDSCCIDKANFTELSAAINSMFRWYMDAAKCYVYLSDVSTRKRSRSSQPLWKLAFRQSRWFTRGWTLQELLAPRIVEFFSQDGKRLGDRNSLEQDIYQATGIAVPALQGRPLSQFSKDERKTWAIKRKTTIEEDQVYCLLGIFSVHLPLIYGEGKENAFRRLNDEIDRHASIPIQGNPPLYKYARITNL